MRQLPPNDRALAKAQVYCPVLTGTKLGSMGEIIKIELDGQPIFLCCKNCIKDAKGDPATTLAQLAEIKKRATSTPSEEERKVRERLAKLSPEDLKLVLQQRLCPLTDEPLASMAVPMRVMVKGEPVFICCKGCKDLVLEKPDEMLKKVKEFKSKTPKK